ncbi:hypothetical protein BHE90_013428 [Fusarium euwallaceae]|uniref:Uncharacterized protein n=2 Tax=Fusarium solani species complex TaxID=232080 RepID=A0A430L8U5_9HYPO|nr:hypothetical protein CEP51_008416 [Fusarium floridanum]RTE72166.1 hypothetical protein BHE90_013428 [Fusarium euwallaceae]
MQAHILRMPKIHLPIHNLRRNGFLGNSRTIWRLQLTSHLEDMEGILRRPCKTTTRLPPVRTSHRNLTRQDLHSTQSLLLGHV